MICFGLLASGEANRGLVLHGLPMIQFLVFWDFGEENYVLVLWRCGILSICDSWNG